METLEQPRGGAMQIGVVYPQTELRGDPGAVRRIGRGAEDLGFDHLLAYDHVLGAVDSADGHLDYLASVAGALSLS